MALKKEFLIMSPSVITQASTVMDMLLFLSLKK